MVMAMTSKTLAKSSLTTVLQFRFFFRYLYFLSRWYDRWQLYMIFFFHPRCQQREILLRVVSEYKIILTDLIFLGSCLKYFCPSFCRFPENHSSLSLFFSYFFKVSTLLIPVAITEAFLFTDWLSDSNVVDPAGVVMPLMRYSNFRYIDISQFKIRTAWSCQSFITTRR